VIIASFIKKKNIMHLMLQELIIIYALNVVSIDI
jgi:hypothetical protein